MKNIMLAAFIFVSTNAFAEKLTDIALGENFRFNELQLNTLVQSVASTSMMKSDPAYSPSGAPSMRMGEVCWVSYFPTSNTVTLGKDTAWTVTQNYNKHIGALNSTEDGMKFQRFTNYQVIQLRAPGGKAAAIVCRDDIDTYEAFTHFGVTRGSNQRVEAQPVNATSTI